MKIQYSFIIIVIALLISCTGKNKKEEVIETRQYEGNRVYKLVIKQLNVFNETDKKVDTELYRYEIDKSEIDYLLKSLPLKYWNKYIEALKDYETGKSNNYKMTDFIIPKLLKITPRGFCYQFSSIGFNKNYDFAFLYTYISNSDICNEDCLYVLMKKNDEWHIITEMIS